jgi:hypothetical protein
VLRTRLLRLVLLDHDQPVAPLVQRVEFNWFVVHRLMAVSKAPSTSAPCSGTGKAVTITTTLISDA